MRVGDSWTKIDYSKQPMEWMVPLKRGQETDLAEIPASWYPDDLPPMLFIKKSPITRCAATQVNPITAKRDLDIVASLGRAFGHINMGVYAEVVAGGAIAVGWRSSPWCSPACCRGRRA